MGTVDYSSDKTPKGYECSSCHKSGIKLWRQYQCAASAVDLLCGVCAMRDQSADYVLGRDGRHLDAYGSYSDQIGWLVPAVPTDDGSFWGYTSVPEDGCAWWKRLPLGTHT